MVLIVILTLLCLAPSILSLPPPNSNAYTNFNFISREQWGARSPEYTEEVTLPVPFVVIHHSYIPGACFSVVECAVAMRAMQNYHQLSNGWEDIGYNFAVGSDGIVYEGRGWGLLGSHAYGYNFRSVGIVLIGDWIKGVPPAVQLDATKKLIQEGIKLGYISEEYDLIGHRQAKTTECPGEALFNEISTWERFRADI